MKRTARLVRGLAALVGLTATIVGVPVGLTLFGQGPPGGLPTWNSFSNGLLHHVSDSALLRGAALLCWLVWALFVVAVAIEIVWQVRGLGQRHSRTPRRIAIPGLQTWARTLVLSAALLLPQRAMVGAVAGPAPGFGPSASETVTASPPGSSAVITPAPAPAHPSVKQAVPPSKAPRRYVVKRYDSLWAIAERHLGSGTRWQEIRDEAGRSLSSHGSQTRTIHPGDVLLLPPAHASAPKRHRSEPSVPLKVAGSHAGISPAAAPAPPVTAPAASTPDPQPVPPIGPTTLPPPTMVAVAADRSSTNGHADTGVLVEAGLAGAAILGVIRLLRRQQAQHRPPGRRIRLPGPTAANTELALRRSETPDRMPLVERAMASLAASLGHPDALPPTIVGVVVDDDSVEVLLANPAPPPPLWIPVAEGFRWRSDTSALPLGGQEQSAPLPALASLGRVAAGTADVLINLEAAGVVGVTGEPSQAAGLLYAIATQLIGAPWAQAVDLVLVAFPPGLAGRDNVRCVLSLSDVAEELRATARVMSATVRQQGCPDLFTGRLRGLAGDGWPPVVVLCAQRPTADELHLLAEIAQPGLGIAAVVANAGGVARWEIDATGQPCPVSPLRLAVQPTVLDASTVAAIAELIRVAEDNTGATLDDPPYDRVEVSVERANRAVPASTFSASLTQRLAHLQPGADASANGADQLPELDDPPVLVRVLGSVEVDGVSEFKRAKSRELVVYLAMHPNGVGESELDEALWGSSGSRVVIASTRDSTVSVARSALGGADRLLPAQGQGREKRYQLGPEVRSDFGQFCVLHRFGRDRQSVTALHRALELVRGRPFEAVVSGRTYGWIHTEGHGRHIEAEVADAADLAAGLYLKAGDPLAARWAARRGLVAEPYTERLWVRLMEAADVLGESQEIERIMDEMDVVLELEGDFTGLHPNTLAVYDRLSRRHRFPVDS